MLAQDVLFIVQELNHLHAEDKHKDAEKSMVVKKHVRVEESHIAENRIIDMLKIS